ncbi:MAG: GNAT family N-acetyltransferase [Treponema sp.]|nr:GNAT family N-acetyltransferase [Treponema sp.]
MIWRRLRRWDIQKASGLLCDMENDYVCACGKYLDSAKNKIWKLKGEKGKISALLINCRSTLLPVFCGINDITQLKFLKSFSGKMKVHSVQGLRNEVLIIENELSNIGMKIIDLFDYDLMSLDTLPLKKNKSSLSGNLLLRPARLTDLEKLAPLQAGYEREEVLPAGSAFYPAASRANLKNIIANGKILAAEFNGKLVGKINVSAVSFTRYLVGGVYVHPDFRGLGIAGVMAGEFISSLISEGRGVTLFVKKNNTPARRLYASLGFTYRADYRITYY